MHLKKIPEASVFIVAAKGEDAADTGAQRMDAAASLRIQKSAGLCFLLHFQIGQDQAVYHIQFDLVIQQLVKGTVQSCGQAEEIIRIQQDTGTHVTAAVAASLTISAAGLYHVP